MQGIFFYIKDIKPKLRSRKKIHYTNLETYSNNNNALMLNLG